MPGALPDHCLSVDGCSRPRLRFAGYCTHHGPSPAEAYTIKAHCVAPLRCYCLLHLGADRHMLGPYEGPETIRIRIATALERHPSP